jgi:Coenzyme PQQ synthesis protein D (PqqD)
MFDPENVAGSKSFEVSPDVIFRRVEDKLVLVKVKDNEIFTLNPTGTRIWELLSDGIRLDAAVTQLASEYGVSEGTIRVEAQAFAAELVRQGFLRA